MVLGYYVVVMECPNPGRGTSLKADYVGHLREYSVSCEISEREGAAGSQGAEKR